MWVVLRRRERRRKLSSRRYVSKSFVVYDDLDPWTEVELDVDGRMSRIEAGEGGACAAGYGQQRRGGASRRPKLGSGGLTQNTIKREGLRAINLTQNLSDLTFFLSLQRFAVK